MLGGIKILVITTVLPGRKRMGSEVATQIVIDALRELGAHLTVVGYIRSKDEYVPRAYEVCAGRRPIETDDAQLRAGLWLVDSLIRRLPYSVSKYRSRRLDSCVKTLLKQENYEIVIVDHAQMSWLLEIVAPLSGKVIGIAHNVEHQMYRSFAEEKSSVRRHLYERESRLLYEIEMSFARKVEQLWVLTKQDKAFFSSIRTNGGTREIALPGGSQGKVVPVAKSVDIALIGSWTWKANSDGLRWFLESVYPLLPTHVAIHVAGNGAQWLAGLHENVHYAGFVDDVQAFLRGARVIAIPTLSGGGIQIKTLDAIASGSRIVATPLALRGIQHYPATIAMAKTNEQFAALLMSAIASPSSAITSDAAVEWSLLRTQTFRRDLIESIGDLLQKH